MDTDNVFEKRLKLNHLNVYQKKFKELNSSDSFFSGITSFSKRQTCIKKYSFAIPDSTALLNISNFSPIVELGAGSGYWAYLLQSIGVDILAYDDGSWDNFWEKKWTDILHGTPNDKNIMSDRNLFLCWPNYNTSFAFDALRNLSGKYFIYIGEYEGCTGDDSFHEYLAKHFDQISYYELPQWFGIHDCLYIYQRKLLDTNSESDRIANSQESMSN